MKFQVVFNFIERLGPSLVSTAIALILSGPGSLQADPLSDLEIRGQQIYRKGTAPGSQISAYYGPIQNEITARLLPCVNCHGIYGKGKPEGGIEPPNITWGELTKPYGHKHSDGRAHPPFDQINLATAITEGVDPEGNKLESAMPRYRMSPQDLEALIAYLKVLGTDLNPGLTETTVQVGILLHSATSPLYSLIVSYFKELNESGGIYGRKIEFVFAKAFRDPNSYAKSVRHLIKDEEVFALFGISNAEADNEVSPMLEQGNVPFITPLILTDRSELKTEIFRFSLFPGLIHQARALVVFAASEMKSARKSAIVLPLEGGISNQIREIVFKEANAHGWPEPETVRYSGNEDEVSRIVADLTQAGIEALFYFGPSRGLLPLMKETENREWSPHLFTPGMVSARQIFSLPRILDDKVFLSNPTVPSDYQKSSLIEFKKLQQKYEVPNHNELQMLSFYATAKVFVEGLRRSGRALSRDKLIQSLENLTDFETGLTPRISFNPNRRTGSLGAYVLSVDLAQQKFKSNPVWISLD